MLTWPVRTAVRVVMTPIALGLLAATIIGLFGATFWVFDLAANFRVQLLELSFFVLLIVVLAKGSIASVAAALALAINLVAVVPVAFGEQPPPRENGQQLVIGHLNVQDRFGDPDGFIDWVGEQQPDVFVVLEASNWTDRIVERGIDGYAITRVPDERRADVLVLSRIPVVVTNAGKATLPKTSAEVSFQLDGQTVKLLAIHTISPVRPWRADRRDVALVAARAWVREATGPVMVIGDFNATPWSAAFKDLVRDAHLRNSLEGFGVQPTWPENHIVVGIPIDHQVFTRQLTAVDRWTGPGFGSSHRSLTTRIAFAE